MPTTELIPDKDALRRVGETVRKRLTASNVYKVPTEKAEIFAVGDFLTPSECQRAMRMIDTVARPSSLYDEDYASGFRTSYSGDLDSYDPLIKAISRRIDPKPGVLLVWNNALPDGSPNENTLHAGTPVVEGVKYVLTKWYRTRRWK